MLEEEFERPLDYVDILFDAILPYFEGKHKEDLPRNEANKYDNRISKKLGFKTKTPNTFRTWYTRRNFLNGDGEKGVASSAQILPRYRNKICEVYELSMNIWDIKNKTKEYAKYIEKNMLDYYKPVQKYIDTQKDIHRAIFGIYLDRLTSEEIAVLKKLDEDKINYESIIKSTKNEFLFEASKKYRKKGQYQSALSLIDKMERYKSDFYFRFIGEIKHEKAILYSSKGVDRYDDALETLQELVGFEYDLKDPEIDILIASNFKRKAILNKNGDSKGQETIERDKKAFEYIDKSINFYRRSHKQIPFLKLMLDNKIKQTSNTEDISYSNISNESIEQIKVLIEKSINGDINTNEVNKLIERIDIVGEECIAEVFKKLEYFSDTTLKDFTNKIKDLFQNNKSKIKDSFGREFYSVAINCENNIDEFEQKCENLYEEYSEKSRFVNNEGRLVGKPLLETFSKDPIWQIAKSHNFEDELRNYCLENFIYDSRLDLNYFKQQYKKLEVYYPAINLCYMEKIKFYLYPEKSNFNNKEEIEDYINSIYEKLKYVYMWNVEHYTDWNWWEYITDIEFKMLAGKSLGDIGGSIQSNWDNITIDHLTATLRQLKNVYVETIGKGQDENAEKLIKILENILDAKQNPA